MTAQRLAYWSNIALVLSGLFEILVSFQTLSGWPLIVSAIACWALLVFGLSGLHARQAKKTGWFGYASLGIVLVGTLFSLIAVIAGNNLFSNALLLSPAAKSIAYLLFETSIVAQTGYFLYGLASLRAGIYPQVVSVLMMIMVLLMIVAGNFGQGLGMIAMGVVLMRGKPAAG
jgi:hypothetical protein